ncbi:MAG: hypothetical protein DLM61_23045 [Pseudonocardiales bacterium]|nr:MAG: hypothetical protein DLM61_23045 [Pseudonocardiales bacterium]
MTERPQLRLTVPGDLPAPTTDADSEAVMAEAVEALSKLRTAYWLGDSTVTLHALASLIAQADNLLTGAVADARDQGLTWTEIAQLLGTSQATAARRHRKQSRST